jgi:hypothetical protein
MARDTVPPLPMTLARRFRPLSGGGRRAAGSFKTVNDLRVGADVNGVGGGSRRTWYPGGTVAIAVRLPRTVAPFWRLGLRGRRGAVEGPRGLSMSWGSLRDSGPHWCAASSDVPGSHNCPAATLRSPLVRFCHVPATPPAARVAKESKGFPESVKGARRCPLVG